MPRRYARARVSARLPAHVHSHLPRHAPATPRRVPPLPLHVTALRLRQRAACRLATCLSHFLFVGARKACAFFITRAQRHLPPAVTHTRPNSQFAAMGFDRALFISGVPDGYDPCPVCLSDVVDDATQCLQGHMCAHGRRSSCLRQCALTRARVSPRPQLLPGVHRGGAASQARVPQRPQQAHAG